MISKERLGEAIELALEWKSSGMTQVKFAAEKGIGVRALEYQIKKVRHHAPEVFSKEEVRKVEFAAVPSIRYDQENEESFMNDQPVLMIQYSGACLQATNQITPALLKTALEVIRTC